MTTLLVEVALFAAGATVLLVAALLLRSLAWADVVVRYRISVAFLIALALLLPVQLIARDLWVPPLKLTFLTAPIEAARQGRQQGDPAGSGGTASQAIDGAGPMLSAWGGSEALAMPGAEAASVGPATAGSPWPSRLLVLYLAGAALVVIVVLLRSSATATIRRHCRPVSDRPRLAAWATARAVVPGPRRVRLVESDHVTAPACWGTVRPTVAIPTGATSADALVPALQHELVHLRRRDPLVRGISMLAAGLLWFHPVMWIFVRLFEQDRERSCDAVVVRATGAARSYARAVLTFCENASRQNHARAGLAFARSRSTRQLQRRIKMIEHANRQLSPVSRRLFGGASAICLAGLLTTQAVLGSAVAEERAAIEQRMAEVVIHAPGGERSAEEALMSAAAHMNVPASPDMLRGISMFDQESIVSAEEAVVEGQTLIANEVRLNLPEASDTTASLSGSAFLMAPELDVTVLTVADGVLELKGPDGTTRATATTGEAARLHITIDRGEEIEFLVRGVDREGDAVPVEVAFDTESGRPADEMDVPHGAIRYQLNGPDDGSRGTYRVKMRWRYVGDDVVREATSVITSNNSLFPRRRRTVHRDGADRDTEAGADERVAQEV